MKKQILTLGFVVFSFMLPVKASAQKVNKIYTFGDSLSDVGNTYTALKPTGIEYPPAPYFKGRFSNGIVWVEYLGQKLKVNPTAYSTLPLGSFNAPGGINYAFVGSGSGLTNVIFPNAPLPGLLAQVGLFTASLKKIDQLADPAALYIVWASSNDYLFGKVTDPQVPVKNVSTAVTTLATVGAKKIMVVNLPDLGKVPGTRLNPQVSSQLSTLTKQHNSKLVQALQGVRKQFNFKVNIMLVDVNTLFNTVIKHPQAFGFKNVTEACLTSTSVCSQPDKYLFWDDYHPTTAAHKQVENLAYLVLRLQSRQAQLTPSLNSETQLTHPQLAQLVFSEPLAKD